MFLYIFKSMFHNKKANLHVNLCEHRTQKILSRVTLNWSLMVANFKISFEADSQ